MNVHQTGGVARLGTDGLTVTDAVVTYPPERRGVLGTTAVAGVSVHVPPGQVLALLGPSGCGKSSLLRAVAGLEPLVAGTVAWDGSDLAGVPVHRRGFGLMFQDGQLFAHRSVAGNVEYGLQVQHLGREERAARVAQLLELVGLEGYGARSVATLSGGERQRVALARSLAPQPRLLLLDEPLSALDLNYQCHVMDLLTQETRDHGLTTLIVLHDLNIALQRSDEALLIRAGELAGHGRPDEVITAESLAQVYEVSARVETCSRGLAHILIDGLCAPAS